MRRSIKRKKLFSLIWLVIFLFIFIVIFLVFNSSFFNIKKIDLAYEGLECINGEQLINSLQLQNKNIFFADTKKIEDIAGKNICVKSVVIEKNPPDKIKISLIPRSSKIRIFQTNILESSHSAYLENIATPSANLNEKSFLVDEEGVIFSENKDITNIPYVFIHQLNYSIGSKLNPYEQNILKIIEKLNTLGVHPVSNLVIDKVFIIYGLPKIVFNLGGDVETQIASLQLILEKAKIDSSQIEFIDLRFDKPIVKFAPKKK